MPSTRRPLTQAELRVLLSAGGRSAPPPWTPAALSSATVRAGLDIPARVGLWQDAGKTVPATADGDPVKRIVDPFTGATYAAAADFTLRYRQGQWCLGPTVGGTYGRVLAATLSVANPAMLAFRYAARAAANAYAVPVSLGGGEQQAGRWNTNVGAFFDLNTLRSGAAYTNGLPQSVVVQYGTGGGYMRQDGVATFTGATNNSANTGGLNIGASYSGAGAAEPVDLSRLVVASGTLSAGDLASLETWLGAGGGHGITAPYLWFGFDYEFETLTVHSSADFASFTMQGNQYYPFGVSNHSVRDPSVVAWGGAYWLAHTWGGLRFGSFPKSQSISLAKAASWPLDWQYLSDLSFATAFVDGAENKCFAPDLSVRGGTLACIAHCRSTNAGVFQPYIRTTTDADLATATWTAAAGITGSAVPANLNDCTHYYDGTADWIVGKELTSGDAGYLVVLKSTGGLTGPYNAGRRLTELDATPAAGSKPYLEGPSLFQRPGGGWWLMYDRFPSGTPTQDQFVLYRSRFGTLDGLLSGSDPLTEETASAADRRTVRHGCPMPL